MSNERCSYGRLAWIKYRMYRRSRTAEWRDYRWENSRPTAVDFAKITLYVTGLSYFSAGKNFFKRKLWPTGCWARCSRLYFSKLPCLFLATRSIGRPLFVFNRWASKAKTEFAHPSYIVQKSHAESATCFSKNKKKAENEPLVHGAKAASALRIGYPLGWHLQTLKGVIGHRCSYP